MGDILSQLKQRRLALKLKQSDMMMRVGVSRQQYQRLESQGNPRLDTLDLIAKGLNSELMLIPREKVGAVKAVLEQGSKTPYTITSESDVSVADNPWQGLLTDKS